MDRYEKEKARMRKRSDDDSVCFWLVRMVMMGGDGVRTVDGSHKASDQAT
jgi:hypothetical protein